MNQTENIQDLAKELGIDYGTSDSQADRLRKIAEAVGMNNYNSLYDNNELEEKLRDLKREKYPNIPHYSAVNNTSSLNELNNKDNKNNKNNNIARNLFRQQNRIGKNFNNGRMTNEFETKKTMPKAPLGMSTDQLLQNNQNTQNELENARGVIPSLGFPSLLGGDSKRKETEEFASDNGGINFKISETVKRTLIFVFPVALIILIFCCLFIGSVQVFTKAIHLGNADSVSDSEANDKITEMQDKRDKIESDVTPEEAGEAYIIDDSSILAYNTSKSNQSFVASKLLDSNLILAKTYLKGKYTEADLDRLEDFYPGVKDLSKNYDEAMVYDFFIKLYKLYTIYNTKYNVNLDMPLIMSTLLIQSEDMNVIFSSNLKAEDRSKTGRASSKYKEVSDYIDLYPEFDINYSFENYKTTETSGPDDMAILAKNMVSEKSIDECSRDELARDGKCYKIDDAKYREFLKEFIEKKYYLSDSTITSGNSNSGTATPNPGGNTSETPNPTPNPNPSAPSTGSFRNWKQCGEPWKNIIVPKSSSTVCKIGCLITSVTMQIARSGTATVVEPINPGVAVKKYTFVKGGNFVWTSTTKLAPNFKYVTAINLTGMSKASIAKKLNSYDASRYYIVLAVSKKNRNKVHHYVALDYVDMNTNDIYIMDPASNNDPNLYSVYKLYKAHIYEKKD